MSPIRMVRNRDISRLLDWGLEDYVVSCTHSTGRVVDEEKSHTCEVTFAICFAEYKVALQPIVRDLSEGLWNLHGVSRPCLYKVGGNVVAQNSILGVAIEARAVEPFIVLFSELEALCFGLVEVERGVNGAPQSAYLLAEVMSV